MKTKILELVEKKHRSSGGSCGTYFVEFLIHFKVSADEFEKIASEMYNNEQIDIRMGINGFMIMQLVPIKKIKNNNLKTK